MVQTSNLSGKWQQEIVNKQVVTPLFKKFVVTTFSNQNQKYQFLSFRKKKKQTWCNEMVLAVLTLWVTRSMCIVGDIVPVQELQLGVSIKMAVLLSFHEVRLYENSPINFDSKTITLYWLSSKPPQWHQQVADMSTTVNVNTVGTKRWTQR